MNDFIEEGVVNVDMAMGEYGFHGDVVIERTELPDGFYKWSSVKDSCFAYGEATGHAHKLFGDFDMRENPDTGERYAVSKGNVITLKHQEHKPRGLLGNDRVYKHRIVKEYDHFENIIRDVAD